MTAGQWAGPSGCGVGSSSPVLVYSTRDELIEFKGFLFHVKLFISSKANEMDIIKIQLIHPTNGQSIF